MMDYFSANRVLFYALGAVALLTVFYCLFFNAPADFPIGTIFQVEQGSSLRSVSLKLKEEHIVRSRLTFEAFIIIYGGEKHMMSGGYVFENKLSVFAVARQILRGKDRIAPIVVTIPEGFNTVQIADVFVSKLVNFNKSKFLSSVEGLEGYLFPDTYFFLITANEADVLKSMSENFEKKIKTILPEILKSDKTEKEIIIIASLIEGEAKEEADRKFISGILWKRLAIGMPLQVDVAPETYKIKGLPKSPIGNPGIESIKAAIYPKNSSYLYYLHDKNGIIHYAKSFTEHRQNVLKYLK